MESCKCNYTWRPVTLATNFPLYRQMALVVRAKHGLLLQAVIYPCGLLEQTIQYKYYMKLMGIGVQEVPHNLEYSDVWPVSELVLQYSFTVEVRLALNNINNSLELYLHVKSVVIAGRIVNTLLT